MTGRYRRFCAVGLVLAGVGLAGASGAQAEGAGAIDESKARQIAQDYFALRTAAVVTEPGETDAATTALSALPATPAFADQLTGELGVLDGRRATLSSMKEEYTDAHTDVEVGEVQATARGAVVKVTETTTLTYARITGDEPPNTAYELEHTLAYEREGSRWVLASDEVNQDGLLPITAIATRTAADSVYDVPQAELAAADPLPHGSAADCGKTNGCDASDAVAADMTVVESSTLDVPFPVTDKADATATAADLQGSSLDGSGSPPAGMNYQRIVSYAYTYWSSYNGNYRSFSNDCTNFISQSLRAGGWPFDTGWYRSDGNWWYNWANQTYTWAGAENWSRFAPKRTSYLDNVYKLLPSDMLLMDFDRNGNMNHAMVVTYKSSTQPYMTYHTTNTKDRSMRSILSSYPNAWYYAYRT